MAFEEGLSKVNLVVAKYDQITEDRATAGVFPRGNVLVEI